MRYSSIANRVVDNKGNTISFAIGLDNQFYVLFESDAAAAHWKKVNLTGAGCHAHAFAVSQNQDGDIFLALARGKSSDSASELLLTKGLSNDMSKACWDDMEPAWRPALETEKKRITDIYLGTDDDGNGAPMVVIATTERKNRLPVHYAVDPNGVDRISQFPKLDDTDQVYDMTIGNLPQARVAYILYRKANRVLLDVQGLPDPETNVPFLTQLEPPVGAMGLEVKYNEAGYSDLHIQANGDYRYRFNEQRAGARGTLIKADGPAIKPKITTRTALTEDYEMTVSGLKRFQTYRTTFSFPPEVRHVDIWASDETDIEIDGKWYSIDRVKPVRVRPNQFKTVVVNIKATQFTCPSLRIHTDTMQPFSRFYACPDVDVSKKVVTLEDDALYEGRKELGISDRFSREDCKHIQTTIQSIVSARQYTYNRTPHGFHHDKALLPANMDDAHFLLDFPAGKPVAYKPLSKQEVHELVKGARRINHDTEQGFLDDIGHFLRKATSVVIHTVESVGEDIIDTVESVGEDVIRSFSVVGEDIVQGNILDIPKDILQGGENIGADLFKGATNVLGDTVKGAGQLLVVTLKFAQEAYQFAIRHTGVIGEFVGKLLEKIGSSLEKALGWLLSEFGWNDVLHTHDYLEQRIIDGVGDAKNILSQLRSTGDRFFAGLEDTIIRDIDEAIKSINPNALGNHPGPVSGHSDAMEKTQWLMARMAGNARSGPLIDSGALAGLGGPFGQVSSLIVDTIGEDGGKVWSAFEDAFKEMEAVFSDPSNAPAHLISALLELAKGVAVAGLEIVNGIFDGVMDLVNGLLEGLLKVLQQPWDIPFISALYEQITEGRKLTLLSLTSLILSIPATSLHKAMFGTVPFASDAGISTSLPRQSEVIRGIGATYSACHLVLAVVSPFVNGKQAVDTISDGFDETFEVDEPNASLSKLDVALDIIGTTIGFVAQMTANPIPPNEPYFMPLDRAKNDIYEAPGYWGHVIWWYQWGGLIVNGLYALGKNVAAGAGAPKSRMSMGGDLMAVLNTLYGICHLGLMATLDQAEHKKASTLERWGTDLWADSTDEEIARELERYSEEQSGEKAYFIVDLHSEEDITKWVNNIRLYKSFANGGGTLGGVPRKGFANVMDTFPEIGQLGASPKMVEATEMISLAVTAGVDLFGHLAEGITYSVRTARNELY